GAGEAILGDALLLDRRWGNGRRTVGHGSVSSGIIRVLEAAFLPQIWLYHILGKRGRMGFGRAGGVNPLILDLAGGIRGLTPPARPFSLSICGNEQFAAPSGFPKATAPPAATGHSLPPVPGTAAGSAPAPLRPPASPADTFRPPEVPAPSRCPPASS